MCDAHLANKYAEAYLNLRAKETGIMGLNDTPNAERIRIGIFGNRNAGKSSLINAITGQTLAVVSDIAGTTTDPVSKAMELLPIGPVLLTDTPGYDDEGELGSLRVAATHKVMEETDIALLVIDSTTHISDNDERILDKLKQRDIPYIIVYSKIDLCHDKNTLSYKSNDTGDNKSKLEENGIRVSAKTGKGITELKDKIGSLNDRIKKNQLRLVADFINEGDRVVLVIPIDESAPKGRLILPQQQAIRDILDADGIAVCVKEDKVKETIGSMKEKPALVITDSQAFESVSKDVPEDIPLTSFSILMARYKGFVDIALQGAYVLDEIDDGDRILISEGCTHHRQCNDIGTVKLPALIRKYTGRDVEFEYSSGGSFPEDIEGLRLVVHCGGCMLSEREVLRRMKALSASGIPVTNYGTAIAHMNGILERSTAILK